MYSYPREVYFSENNICIGVGHGGCNAPYLYKYSIVMDLPSDHYDFCGPFGGTLKGLHMGQIMSLLYTPKRFYTKEEISENEIGDYAITVGGLYYLPGK